MRRRRRFFVSGVFLDQIFTARPEKDRMFKGITSDAPEDMHVVGVCDYEPMRDTWTFIAESAVFDEVPEGADPPLWAPTFTSHYLSESEDSE